MRTAILLVLLTVALSQARAQRFDDDLTESLEGDQRDDRFTFVILSQPNSRYHTVQAQRLHKELTRQTFVWKFAHRPQILTTHIDFPDIRGSWAVWPLLQKLHEKSSEYHQGFSHWLVFLKEDTVVRVDILLDVLLTENPNAEVFLGHKLVDRFRSIIHHFAEAQEDASVKPLEYPSFAAGFIASSTLMSKVSDKLATKPRSDFTIDAKYEVKPLSIVQHDMSTKQKRCARAERNLSLVENDQIVFAVKTWHENHKTRIVVVKRTWAKYAAVVDYFSDLYDVFIPSIELDIENTERGHCDKTLAIMRHFIDMLEYQDKKWLLVVDDDTLLSVTRIVDLLRCYDPTQSVIVGERYGYGFTSDGRDGYDYPTGGAGMAFSRPAVEQLLQSCKCPSADSPDDMIIGMCSLSQKIPIYTSDALHQARPDDYAVDYLAQQPPASFHKHWNVDPYQVYNDYLANEGDTLVGAHHVAHDADDAFMKHHLEGERHSAEGEELQEAMRENSKMEDEHREL